MLSRGDEALALGQRSLLILDVWHRIGVKAVKRGFDETKPEGQVV